jgi:hypothetical protein
MGETANLQRSWSPTLSVTAGSPGRTRSARSRASGRSVATSLTVRSRSTTAALSSARATAASSSFAAWSTRSAGRSRCLTPWRQEFARQQAIRPRAGVGLKAEHYRTILGTRRAPVRPVRRGNRQAPPKPVLGRPRFGRTRQYFGSRKQDTPVRLTISRLATFLHKRFSGRERTGHRLFRETKH